MLQILATHGVKGFFKGLSTPLVTVAAFNAVLFAARGGMERLLAHSDGQPQMHLCPTRPYRPLWRHASAVQWAFD